MVQTVLQDSQSGKAGAHGERPVKDTVSKVAPEGRPEHRQVEREIKAIHCRRTLREMLWKTQCMWKAEN